MTITCAVIGNSPILLSSTYGVEIDSHDEVIRCNAAPIKGLKEDVGSKTTIRAINCWLSRLFIDPEKVFTDPGYKHLLENFSNWENTSVSDLLECNALFLKDCDPPHQHVVSVVGETHDVFGLTKDGFDSMTKLSNSSNPTTGFCAVVWASENFDTVDCYGFDFYEKAQEGDTKLHYYEEVYNFKGYEWHNFQKEREVLSSLPNVTFHY